MISPIAADIRSSSYYAPANIKESVAVLQQAMQLAERIGNKKTLKTNVVGLSEVVTAADPACERFIIEQLRLGQSPYPACIGEESAKQRRLPEDYDSLDPIDGTLSFAHGDSRWGVLLGAVRAGRPIAGIALQRGGQKGLSVLTETQDVKLWDLSNVNAAEVAYRQLDRPRSIPARMLFTPGYYSAGTTEHVQRVAETLGLELAPAASAVHATFLLAEGAACGFLCYGGKVWDQAPLAALLHAWGGGEIDVSSGRARDWSSIASRLVHGFDIALTKEFALALREVRFENIPPEEQWVPKEGLA